MSGLLAPSTNPYLFKRQPEPAGVFDNQLNPQSAETAEKENGGSNAGHHGNVSLQDDKQVWLATQCCTCAMHSIQQSSHCCYGTIDHHA
jgi:hypothetical protein